MMIAVAGKGGVGKTTVASLLLRGLAAAKVAPLLAVDADPNANLHLLLGLPAPRPLGSLREELLAAEGGTPKEDLLAAMVEQRVEEGEEVDLIAMGRGEGPGCYCYVNNLLRRTLLRLQGAYRAVVVDNEAGMEHLSRRNLSAIDHLVLVADPSPRGLAAARTIAELARGLPLTVRRSWLVLNAAYGTLSAGGEALPEGVDLLAEVPYDPLLPAWEEEGKSFLDIPGTSPAAAFMEKAVRDSLLPAHPF